MKIPTALPAALLAFAATTLLPAASAPRPPNIVFILADDLGYGDLGCYGQKKLATPHLDRLAKEGMRFTQFYAGDTVCAPSRSVLMTGQHAGHTRIRGNAKLDLKPEDVTVAEVLKSAGYATGLVGKWGLGSEGGTGAPLQQGFDHFFGYMDQTHAHNYYPTFLVRDNQRVPLRNVVPNPGPYGQGVATVRVDYSHDLMAADALDFIQQHRDEPFFLYAAFTLPHANDEMKPDGMEVPDHGRFEKEAWPSPEKGFASMVTRLDDDVGRITAKLQALGLSDHTLVIFASDNGAHGEGGHDPDFFHSRGGLRGIKRAMYEGGIRVPFIARWPGHVAPGTVSDHVAYFGDFMATAAEITGARAPAKLDSLSFLPALEGRASAQKEPEFLYGEFYEGGTSQAVRQGNWKAIRAPMLSGKVELYDLHDDPSESHDVAAGHADIVARLTSRMDREHVPSPDFKVPSKS
jgi:arylsulfatase A-like enzyme